MHDTCEMLITCGAHVGRVHDRPRHVEMSPALRRVAGS